MSKPKGRSKEENVRELRRLQEMYNRLPPDKKKSMRPHMQARIDQLNAAISGGGSGGGGGRSSGGSAMVNTLTTILLAVLIALVALGAGFFGVSYLMKG